MLQGVQQVLEQFSGFKVLKVSESFQGVSEGFQGV